MSIRRAGGEWEHLMLGIEPESCGVCHRGLSRDTTMLSGGWARCSVCHHFVHYACLASGKFKFLKKRPRICQTCAGDSPQAVKSADACEPVSP